MEVLVLLSLASLVSARCNNILPTGCGQNGQLNGFYSIFNTGVSQPSVKGTSGGGRRIRNCLSTEVIPVSLRDVFSKQPSYTRVIENTIENQFRDNVCTTFFTVPDDDRSFLAYVSTVNIDGSNKVDSFLYTEIAPGVFGVANADYTLTQRVFASIGDNLLLTCVRTEFGDSEFPEFVASSIGTLNPFGYSCVNQIQKILDCNGLCRDEGLYVLPYRLPPRCYARQTCFSRNPFTLSS